MRPEDLIIKYLKDQLTPAEDKELQDWINASEDNRRLLKRLSNPEYLQEKLTRRQRVNKQQEWEKIREAVFQDGVPFPDPAPEIIPLKSRLWIVWRRYLSAAVLTGLITGGAWLWIKYHPPAKPPGPAAPPIVKHQPPRKIPPGGNKTILTLSDETQIVLDCTHKGTIAYQGNSRIEQYGKGRLTYKALNDRPGNILYNVLTTPAAGQYQLTLPDGSRVWLNNLSSLRYPAAFNGTRQVELSGEAYFEIEHDPAMPFNVVVHNGKNDMIARALGTSFSITAYPDENKIRTTLFSGKMKISRGDSAESLEPGQQASLDSTGALYIYTDPHAAETISWKDGAFYFDNADLRDVLRTLARWYDVQVEYKEEIAGKNKFSGHLPRNINLSQVPDLLKWNGVHIAIDNKKIIVSAEPAH